MKTNGRPPANANGTNPDPPATNGINGTHNAPANKRKQATNGSQPTTAAPSQPGKAKSSTHHNDKPPAKRPSAGNKTRRPLTVRQERFAELMASGICQTEAWVRVYGTSREVARVNATQALVNPNLTDRIAELRKPQTKAAMLSKEEKLAFLAEIIRTPVGEVGPDSRLCQEYTEEVIGGGTRGKLKRGSAPSGNETEGMTVIRQRSKMADKLRALELHSKLVGDFEPDRIEVEDGPKRLETIRERSAQIVSAMNRRALERSFESGATTTGSGLSRWNPNITRG